ncbi:hypothetical protein GCM10009092_17490 [Bowmanella denitrificans]|uniref:Uncharacterized protein n=2 Tax=Bowmanella denitrificans TaxID=366582 RepID=A0ABN0X2P8_9ALTE
MYESIFLWSPIIEVSKNSKIQFKASSRAANGIYPTLGITIYDSDTGEAVWSEKEKFVGENTVFTLSPPGNATRVYLRLRLHDYIFDQDNREYQLVELRDFKVE